MAGGRPLKFGTVEELQSKIDLYFNSLAPDEPITITGLALALDTSRETLCNYEDKDQFFDTIKKAKLRCENYAEKQLFIRGTAGSIFALKNYGWKDKKEIDNNVAMNLVVANPNDEDI